MIEKKAKSRRQFLCPIRHFQLLQYDILKNVLKNTSIAYLHVHTLQKKTIFIRSQLDNILVKLQ